MGVSTRMAADKNTKAAMRENAILDMYKNDKHYRADRLN